MVTTKDPDTGHDKSIRKRLTRTVLIPSITLLVLWIAVSSYFVFNGLYAKLVADSVRQVSIPAVTALSAIQQERQIGVEFLVNTGVGLPELTERQQRTDQKLAELNAVFGPAIESAPDRIASRMRELKAGFDKLPVVRSQIGVKTVSKAQVNEFYNGILDSAARLFDVQARIVPDEIAVQGAISATVAFRVTDTMSREASLVTSAYAAGTMSGEDFVQFTQLAGAYRADLTQTAPFFEPAARARYEAMVGTDEWKRFTAAEEALVKRGPWTARDKATLPVSQAEWQSTSNAVAAALAEMTVEQADKVSAAAIVSGENQLRNAIIGSVIALLISVASVVVAVRVSRTLVDRTLVTRLERLRDDSLELAGHRLPDIVHRLKSGENVDVSEELPRLDHGRDEIGQVAEALNIAQLTAVNAAVSEAKARSGVHNVFLGIAHRNQVLVHRQLQILDEMEKREEDSSQLASLFQLDHLATRARRTTENLIILGGKQPGRRWRNPVPLMEVLRAAVSETEHYARVRVESIPEISVIGSAVADAIHLVAELVDNGTSFSPPDSQVEVTATPVARGVVVEISDQGLGMKDAVRDWANAMMSDAPEFDAMALRADTSLGLFVVARIASRLAITVTFDPSRYGGTRATVLIPTNILVSAGQTEEAGVVGEPVLPERRLTEPEPPVPATPVRDTPLRATPVHPTPVQETSVPQPSVWVQPREAAQSNGVLPRPAVEPRATPLTQGERSAGATRKPAVPAETAGPPEPKPGRAPLPQRRPQQNLVSQLREEPAAVDNADGPGADQGGYGQAGTLSAFHKGTRRGRESDVTAD